MLTAFHLTGRLRGGVLLGCGAMAQLVARLHGMQKVRGSNPLSSTAFFGSLFEGKAPNQEPRRLGQALSSFSSPKSLSMTVALLRIAVGMYVDKPLAGVAAVQALSRLQRTRPLKFTDDVRAGRRAWSGGRATAEGRYMLCDA